MKNRLVHIDLNLSTRDALGSWSTFWTQRYDGDNTEVRNYAVKTHLRWRRVSYMMNAFKDKYLRQL